ERPPGARGRIGLHVARRAGRWRRPSAVHRRGRAVARDLQLHAPGGVASRAPERSHPARPGAVRRAHERGRGPPHAGGALDLPLELGVRGISGARRRSRARLRGYLRTGPSATLRQNPGGDALTYTSLDRILISDVSVRWTGHLSAISSVLSRCSSVRFPSRAISHSMRSSMPCRVSHSAQSSAWTLEWRSRTVTPVSGHRCRRAYSA